MKMVRVRTELVDDLDEARELHHAYMDGCTFPGEDHQFWRAVLPGTLTVVAMCSAVVRSEKCYVYLSSAGVDEIYAGVGLQRYMIRMRCRWGKRQGATHAVTYTLLHNYPSIVNLIRCGFRFAEKPRGWTGVAGDVHYFEKEL